MFFDLFDLLSDLSLFDEDDVEELLLWWTFDESLVLLVDLLDLSSELLLLLDDDELCSFLFFEDFVLLLVLSDVLSLLWSGLLLFVDLPFELDVDNELVSVSSDNSESSLFFILSAFNLSLFGTPIDDGDKEGNFGVF